MCRQLLSHLAVKAFYYYSLLIGLIPAPVDWQSLEVRQSRIYLCYSLVFHSFCLAVVPFVSYFVYQKTYIYNDPLLKWIYLLSDNIRNLCLILLIKDIWCKRRQLIGLLQSYRAFVRRYDVLRSAARIEDQRVDCRVERLTICKFLTAFTYSLFRTIFAVGVHSSIEYTFLLSLFLAHTIATFAQVAAGQFFFGLCHLYRQFEHVNLELRELLLHLRQLASATGQSAEEEIKAPGCQDLLLRLSSLRSMHQDCYRLTMDVFRIYGTPAAAFMLRLFVISVRTVFHIVLFTNHRVTSDLWHLLSAFSLAISFFLDTVLLMGVVDRVLTSCNETGRILKGATDLPELKGIGQMTNVFEQFADYLRCHRLEYRVCGLFECSRATCLKYFASVYVHITIMVQFDLENKLHSK